MDYCFTPLDLLDLLRSRFCLSTSLVLSPVLLGVRLAKREALGICRGVLISGENLGECCWDLFAANIGVCAAQGVAAVFGPLQTVSIYVILF